MSDNARVSLDVHGENVKIWRRDFETKNGIWHRYSISTSTKNEDGSYSNAYVQIRFAKSANAPEVLNNGSVCDFKGFMSAVKSGRKNDKGQDLFDPLIVITEVSFEGDVTADEPIESDSFEQLDEDIPF